MDANNTKRVLNERVDGDWWGCVQMEDAGIEVPADHPSVMEWFKDMVMEEARRDAEGNAGQQANGSRGQREPRVWVNPNNRGGTANTSNRQCPLCFAPL